MTTWRETVATQCVGVTQEGRKCTRERPDWWTDHDYHIDLWLCQDHEDQAPGSWRMRRQAVREIGDLVLAVTKRHAELTAHVLHELVYFASDGQYLKIGTSLDPDIRVSQLRGSTQEPADVDWGQMTVVATIPGGHRVEKMLHRLMGAHRVPETIEWFRDTRELRADLALYGVEGPAGPARAKRVAA